MIRGFQTYELAVQLYRRVETLETPKHMRDQLLRAAQSVVLNLSEGSAKPTSRDKRKFFAIAFGSIREVQAVFDLIQNCDRDLIDLADRVAACLYRLTYKAVRQPFP